MGLFSLFKKKPAESPQEELHRIVFRLQDYDVPGRTKLESRKAELEAQLGVSSKKPPPKP